MALLALLLAASPVGVDLSASTGIEAGMGETSAGRSLWSTASGSVPFGLEVGAHVAQRWFVGAYGHFAPTLRAPAEADSPSAALATFSSGPPPLHVRVGLLAQLRVLADARVDPFVGLGLGFEGLGALRGAEGLLQVGAEVRLTDAWFVGAAAVGTLGVFGPSTSVRKTYNVVGTGSTRPVGYGPEAHGWAGLALRVRFAL